MEENKPTRIHYSVVSNLCLRDLIFVSLSPLPPTFVVVAGFCFGMISFGNADVWEFAGQYIVQKTELFIKGGGGGSSDLFK